MSTSNTVVIAILAIALGVVVGGIGTYLLVATNTSEDEPAVNVSAEKVTKNPSSVFVALDPKAITADFVPNPGQTFQIEESRKTDVNDGVHQKYFAIAFQNGGVEQFVTELARQLSSTRLDDEIVTLNRFERDIPDSIIKAGGTITTTTSGRGTHGGDSIQTRYSFDYDCETARGTIRVWVIARNDECSLIVLVTEQIT